MPTELEHRLERLLSAQPRSTPSAEEQAREAALAAIPPARRRRRPAAWMILAAAGIAVAMTGVALAASPGSFRELRDVVAPAPRAAKSGPAKSEVEVVPVPRGAAGFTVQVGSRLWVATPRGIALRGVPLGAAATSPQALYAVGETAGRLEAVSIADRHVAWSVPLHGRLVAATWSPYPIRIAYIVRSGDRRVLHLIWGNGVNDQVVAPSAPVMPAWRSDSLAVAYIAPTGAVMLDTVGRAPQQVNRGAVCGAHRITGLAFSPSSATLAEATDGPVMALVDTRHPGRVSCIRTGGAATGLRWLSTANLLFWHPGSDRLTRIATNHRRLVARGTLIAPGPILGAAVSPDGRHIAIAVRHGDRLRILTAAPPELGSAKVLKPAQRLGLAPPAGRAVRIGWS